MKDQFAESGFELIGNNYNDLDIYSRDAVLLIVLKKFKSDKKAFRVASNHIDERLVTELNDVLDHSVSRSQFHSVILTSAHKVVFSRGAKIEPVKDLSTEECEQFISVGQQLVSKIQNCPKVFVAAVNGLALGGGLELAMACDYRIASTRDNVILGLPEAHLGLIPAMGGIVNGVHILGRDEIYDIVSKGKVDITSERALKIGLADQLAEPQNLIESAYMLASERAIPKKSLFISGETIKSSEEHQKAISEYLSTVTLPKASDIAVAPIAYTLLSYVIDRRDSDNLLESLSYEREVFCYLQKTDDCKEGIDALINERLPLFEGR